jgi:uncharacterized phiE125 gp8 family phage protein
MTGGIGAGVYGPQGLWGWLAPNGSIALTDSSPPQTFEEPFTLEEIKAFLKIPVRSPTDPEEDALICDLISAARVVAEYFQGRDLVLKQWDLHLDFWIDYFIKLRDNLISVDLFQVRSSDGSYDTLVENTDFIVDTSKSPGLVAPPYNEMWFTFTPWPSSAILIRFTCGIANNSVFWQADGRAVKAGMRRLIADWYSNRLPFEKLLDPAREIPFGVTALLTTGALKHVG